MAKKNQWIPVIANLHGQKTAEPIFWYLNNVKKLFSPQRHPDVASGCLCVFVASFFALLLSGCVSLDPSAKKDEVAEMRSSVSQEIINVKQEVNSLKGQIDELEYKIDKISQGQSQQSNEINATLKEWRKETQNDLDTKLQTLEKREEQDKKELVEKINIITEEVSKENKELRKQIESMRTPAVYPTEGGYYVVSEGDTLLKITQMFGVSLKNLMDANGITDPNSIRKGQKLIIPQKK